MNKHAGMSLLLSFSPIGWRFGIIDSDGRTKHFSIEIYRKIYNHTQHLSGMNFYCFGHLHF